MKIKCPRCKRLMEKNPSNTNEYKCTACGTTLSVVFGPCATIKEWLKNPKKCPVCTAYIGTELQTRVYLNHNATVVIDVNCPQCNYSWYVLAELKEYYGVSKGDSDD